MKTQFCRDCIYWWEIVATPENSYGPAQEVGRCLFNPPVADQKRPFTLGSEFCHEFYGKDIKLENTK